MARLTAYDSNGETLVEREVNAWFISDEGPHEDGLGLCISFGPTDITENYDSEVKLQLTLSEEELRKYGWHTKGTLPTEEELLEHGYVKVFPCGNYEAPRNWF